MSEGLTYSDNPLSGDRRLGPRQHASSIMYVKLGEHNGGVILNLGEGGLAVQAAMLLKGDALALSFQLSAKKWLKQMLELFGQRRGLRDCVSTTYRKQRAARLENGSVSRKTSRRRPWRRKQISMLSI